MSYMYTHTHTHTLTHLHTHTHTSMQQQDFCLILDCPVRCLLQVPAV